MQGRSYESHGVSYHTSTTGFGTLSQQAKAIAQADAERDAELTAIPDGLAKSVGIAIGKAAAVAIIKLRSTDHAISAEVPYTPGTLRATGSRHPTPALRIHQGLPVMCLRRSLAGAGLLPSS
ncbi:MAG: hypothetical protein WB676_30915 [Bryobacteraceae bacterium]